MILQVLPSPQHHKKPSPWVCRSAGTLEVLGGFVTHNLSSVDRCPHGDTRRKDPGTSNLEPSAQDGAPQ